MTCLFSNVTNAVDSSVTSLLDQGLALSPLRNELNIDPGTSLDGVITVTNKTSHNMTINLSAEEFSVINQQYDYAFTVESNVAKWVTFNLNEVDLMAGEAKDISFTVGAPLSAEPGGRYIGLFASTNTGVMGDSAVSSQQRIASLLYITVLGDVTRSGNLVSLLSPWAVGGDSTWSAALQNTGTTHFRSRYNVQVVDLFGNNIAASGQGDSLILPGTVRFISDELPIPKLPGVYKLIFTIGLGDTPAVIKTRYLFYAPPLSIILTIVLVMLIILALRRRRLIKT